MNRAFAMALALAALLLAGQLGSGTASAQTSSTIDFEGLAEGAIVSNVSFGNGISGDDAGGSVGVFGLNPSFPPATNTAQIFDADCDGADPCTGGDDDLSFPAHGNILIICEESGSTDTCKSPPDDADLENSFFKFDFSTWGPGVVCVDSIDVLDVESVEQPGARIEVFSGGEGGTLLAAVAIPATGDHNSATVNVNQCGVDFMRVTLNGSGAIDNIEIRTEDGGGEGCTPGYWKNLRQHLDEWTAAGFAPGDSYEAIFGVDAPGTPTLEDAINANGGGVNKLLRFSTAALLNAGHPGVDSGQSVAEVIALTQNAFATGNFNAFDGFFDDEVCPLS